MAVVATSLLASGCAKTSAKTDDMAIIVQLAENTAMKADFAAISFSSSGD